MKAAWYWLALGAFSAHGQVGGGPTAPFAVYTQFEHEPSPAVVDALRSELSSIMYPLGLRYVWRSLAAPRVTESFGELAVVTFQGRCDLATLFPESMRPSALGWTHITDGRIIPFAGVDCDKTRVFLSRSLLRVRPQERNAVFGRAVARVLAHELYHVFTHTRHHGSSGLAEAAYTPPELMSDDFAFAESDQKLLAAALPGNRPLNTEAGQSLFAHSGCAGCHGARLLGTSRGPSLRGVGRSLDAAHLARLVGKASKMYRRARELKIAWHPMDRTDIESLLTYLAAAE